VALQNEPGATARQSRVNRRTILGGTLITMLLLTGGWVMAASFTVTVGNTENGGGTYHATSSLTYWTEASVGVATQPGTLPTALSTTLATPTVLAGAATNYAVNPPALNDLAHYWKFTEAVTAPINTELELAFTVSTGAGPTITAVTVYVETQGAAIGTPITFALYYDLGSPSSGTITLNAVTEISQQCQVAGTTCP
jgi:hypothetical protein